MREFHKQFLIFPKMKNEIRVASSWNFVRIHFHSVWRSMKVETEKWIEIICNTFELVCSLKMVNIKETKQCSSMNEKPKKKSSEWNAFMEQYEEGFLECDNVVKSQVARKSDLNHQFSKYLHFDLTFECLNGRLGVV